MKILIIGAGSIGTRHLKNLLKLGYKNLVVSDPDEKKLKVAALLGNFSLYKNAKTAIEKERPKLVFIEKPLSNNLAGVDALIKKVARGKKVVMPACNFLFYEGFKKLQSVLKSMVYGKAMLCRVAQGFYIPWARKNINYKKSYIAKKTEGGGVILDHVTHSIYYLSALFGDIKKAALLLSDKHPLGFKSEEMAVLMLEHKNGVISGIASDYICKKTTHRIEVVTEKGTLTLDIGEDTLIFEDRKIKKELYIGDINLNKMFVEEIKHFLNCIKNNSEPLQGLRAAKNVLKVLIRAKKI